MVLLIPGRHHVVTRTQERYLWRFFQAGLEGETDTRGRPLSGPVEAAVFAVTSADHQGTRRNPFSFAHRAMALHDLGTNLGRPLFAYPIPEAGQRPDFAEYTLKTLEHASRGLWVLSPENTVVVCATPVGRLYEELGFRVWAAEALKGEPLPWQILETAAQSPDWRRDPAVLADLHPVSFAVMDRYRLGELAAELWSDPVVGADGDLTSTRDYGTYVRQMDENMGQKWEETRPFIQPGRIGDIGCAVGSWLRLATLDPQLADSDFYGIEIARPLFDICEQRRHNGEFGTPHIWFSQKNAVTGQVFKAGSMTSIHTGSLTHEIESYGGRADLLAFLQRRREELAPGGVWVNRDVVGPEEGRRVVWLDLNDQDGQSRRVLPRPQGGEDLRRWLDALSTAARFEVFAAEFRQAEGASVAYEELPGAEAGWRRFRLSLREAAEYLLTKDYTDNWDSEMHETFCHWALSDWQRELEAVGFSLQPGTKTWVNPWILENRWLGQAALHDEQGNPLPWPPTNLLIVAKA